MTYLLHAVDSGETEKGGVMADDIDRRTSGIDDRRESRPVGAWQDPKTWMAAFGILLSVCGLLLTLVLFIANKMLDEMKEMNKNIVSINQTTSNALTAQSKDINYLKDNQKIAWDFIRDQYAYNLNVNKSMTEITTTMRLRGLPTPNIPDPPKLGGQ